MWRRPARLIAMSAVDKKWAERIRGGDRRALERQFKHEAGELQRIVSEHPQGVHPPWRDFRCFLADVGPSPGPAYKLLGDASCGGYGPGEARWVLQSSKLKAAPPPPPATSHSSHSQWTMIAGMPVPYSELPARLGLSFSALSAAISAGCPIEELVARAGEAQAQVVDLTWFSESVIHQKAFRDAYMAWRLRISPRYHGAATPQFLYLFMLLPTMARCKATLVDADLWNPLTRQALEARDASPAWKRFNELLPKAMTVLGSFEIYRQYSLTDDIAELSERVTTAERRFRTGVAEAQRSIAA